MTDNLIEPANIPANPRYPRADVYSEGIYLRAWQQLLAEDEGGDDESGVRAPTFSDTLRPWNQEQATAAASFICWLGTSCGRGYLWEAKRRWSEATGFDRERAYLTRWHVENERRAGVNHGLRLIEFLLAREHPVGHSTIGLYGKVFADRIPTITMDHIDAIECVAWWLGTPRGQEFIEDCERVIAKERERRRRREDLEHALRWAPADARPNMIAWAQLGEIAP